MKRLKTILAVAVTVLILVVSTGCNSSDKKEGKVVPSPSVTTDMRYIGQHKGCLAHYNDLFCPSEYKNGTLAAGSVAYIRDSNGSMIILDTLTEGVPKGTKVYYKMEGDK